MNAEHHFEAARRMVPLRRSPPPLLLPSARCSMVTGGDSRVGFGPTVSASSTGNALNRAWLDLIETEPLAALGAEAVPAGPIPMALDGAIEFETWLEDDELKF